jgi:hypothetical protein
MLGNLFDPQTMTRISDEQLKVAQPGDTMSLADLFAWTQAAVWEDLTGSNQIHRNLQSRWTNLLIAMTLAPDGLIRQLGYPIESSALARSTLSDLQPKMRAALAKPLDRGVRAQLADLMHRIDNALTARAIQG